MDDKVLNESVKVLNESIKVLSESKKEKISKSKFPYFYELELKRSVKKDDQLYEIAVDHVYIESAYDVQHIIYNIAIWKDKELWMHMKYDMFWCNYAQNYNDDYPELQIKKFGNISYEEFEELVGLKFGFKEDYNSIIKEKFQQKK